MKNYICTKVIQAVPVKMVNGCFWPEDLPLPEIPEPVQTENEGCIKYGTRVEEGYMFTESRDDQFARFMSAAEFEQNCRPVDSMTFGDALEAVKRGQRIARKGWNGKAMYVFLAYEADFVTDADIYAYDQLEVEVGDMLVMKTAQDTFQPGWLASQADMLAEDWFIVE